MLPTIKKRSSSGGSSVGPATRYSASSLNEATSTTSSSPHPTAIPHPCVSGPRMPHKAKWTLPQELRDGQPRQCRTSAGRPMRGTVADPTTERVVTATQSVIFKRRQTEDYQHRVFQSHIRDKKQLAKQKRDQLLEATRQRMHAIKQDRQKRLSMIRGDMQPSS
eukprot:m.18129 g.18129  ORF g.18129 m.18129 type:complete len:164 (-) comp3568_c0_seq2:148-639(-)